MFRNEGITRYDHVDQKGKCGKQIEGKRKMMEWSSQSEVLVVVSLTVMKVGPVKFVWELSWRVQI